jgi:hypothetical protein
MKKNYIFISLLLMVTNLYTSCRKQEPAIVQNNVNVATDSISNEASSLVLHEEKTAQKIIESNAKIAPEVRETIENYGLIAPELNQPNPLNLGRFAFQIEGNFTNSGNREIVAFYERAYVPFGGSISLTSVFCFVLDKNEEKIEKIYYIDWQTIAYREKIEAGLGLTEDLGKYIVWRDWIIGCVGDFNRNEKDELYLYSLSGMGSQPYFFEFDETGFVELLGLETTNAFIDSVDIKKKIINIREQYTTDSIPMIRVIEISSYIWDNDTRRYVVLARERKEYHWNVDTQQFEEIIW